MTVFGLDYVDLNWLLDDCDIMRLWLKRRELILMCIVNIYTVG